METERRRRFSASVAHLATALDAGETDSTEPESDRGARERPSNVFSNCVVWYARTIGTNDAPWLVRTEAGETWLCARVSFTRATTRLLSDDERSRYPDSPRGVVECELAMAYGARRLPA
jgi:hypothetical protein